MHDMILSVAVLFGSVILSAYAQILLKKSALRRYDSRVREYLNPLVVGGYGIFFLAILLDMIALRSVPVSYLPVIESSSYVFVLVFSRIFLGERLAKRQLAAILVILCGIALYLL